MSAFQSQFAYSLNDVAYPNCKICFLSVFLASLKQDNSLVNSSPNTTNLKSDPCLEIFWSVSKNRSGFLSYSHRWFHNMIGSSLLFFDINLNKYPSKSFIKGDEISLSIATASIIAKIHRDRYMRFLSYFFPYYNWSSNAGYGTKKHIEQICKKGITSHHRKTFEPIKSLIHKKWFSLLIT